jgi:hypothetical protein
MARRCEATAFGGKGCRRCTGLRLRKEAELNAINLGATVAQDGQAHPRKHSLTAAVADYLAEIKMSRSRATHSAYSLSLRNFAEGCAKTYIEDVDRLDLLAFVHGMRTEGGLSDRTCHNRFEHLLTFLKAHGIPPDKYSAEVASKLQLSVGTAGFFNRIGLTGIPLTVALFALIVCGLTFLALRLDADLFKGLLDLKKLTVGAFIGSLTKDRAQSQQPNQN